MLLLLNTCVKIAKLICKNKIVANYS